MNPAIPPGLAGRLTLYLVRCHGDPVALVAASDRSTATRRTVTLDPTLPVGDMTTIAVGTAKEFAAGIVADLRTAHGQANRPPIPTPRTLAAQARVAASFARQPVDHAPPSGLAAFRAVCLERGVNEARARESQSPLATRLRRGVWLAMVDAGYTNRAAGLVTTHHDGTVSHTVIAERQRRAAGLPDEIADAAYITAARVIQDKERAIIGGAEDEDDTGDA